jgi:hypothetical protein
MMFKSDLVFAQWDTWVYLHDGTYYLYYLITSDRPDIGFDGFGVATSTDGVHWQDHGRAIGPSDKMVLFLGTGAVWKAADFETSGRFICNYSEFRAEPGSEKPTQNILFAWSTDLIHWHKCGDEAMFRVDERYYERFGRWDCIFPLLRGSSERDGYYGTWTATPKSAGNLNAGIGFGYSDDGLTWVAQPPAQVDPPADESGAFHRFNGRVYAMFGKWDTGMVCYEAEEVNGPFCRADRNAVLLGGGLRHTYFARFCPTPQGVLVNHHSMTGETNGKTITYAAPFKLAVVEDGVLRWRFWPANEALKGERVPAQPAVTFSAVSLMTGALDFARGVVAEGTLRLPDDGEPCGLYVLAGGQGFAIKVCRDGRVEMGPLNPSGDGWNAPLQTADRGLPLGATAQFRLLARRGMLELYLDDYFVECCTLGCAHEPTVRLGVLNAPARCLDGELAVWQMSLLGDSTN